jgi:hypothetical protein
MAKTCNKKQTTKNRDIAEMTTRKNKIRKFEKIVRNNPNDFCAKNTLAQLYWDSGVRK